MGAEHPPPPHVNKPGSRGSSSLLSQPAGGSYGGGEGCFGLGLSRASKGQETTLMAPCRNWLLPPPPPPLAKQIYLSLAFKCEGGGVLPKLADRIGTEA
jgi:hypothetical protein